MEVPIEEMPQPARGRIKSLMKTVAWRCDIEKKMETAELLAKFFAGLPFPFLMEKQVGDGEIEEWVYNRLMRDDAWVDDMARSLYDEAVITIEEATRAQLCSSIGKDVPEGYELSGAEEEEAWRSCLESAQSVADTYNEKLRQWIVEAKAEWWKDHGESYIGLNRWTLLKLVQAKVEEYDEWKVPQIAATEFSTQWNRQALSFWVVNKGDAELEYYLAPETASDPARDTIPICMEYAGRWLDAKDASMFPAHPNCVHYVSRTRAISGALPFYFVIGGVRYEAEALPDC